MNEIMGRGPEGRVQNRATRRLVGDAVWIRTARAVMSPFLDARTSRFERDDFDGARAWLLA